MIVETVFDTKVIRIPCPNAELYKNKELTKSLDRVFELDDVKGFDYNKFPNSKQGTGLSFCGHQYLSLNNLPGTSALTQWVTDTLLSVREELGFHGNTIDFKRSWGNRIFKGCQGRSHNHQGDDPNYPHIDLVAILYVDVPPNGSKLVLIKDGEKGKLHGEFTEDRKYYIDPKEGELIIHNPLIYHAVTEHFNDLPRNCFVYDAAYA